MLPSMAIERTSHRIYEQGAAYRSRSHMGEAPYLPPDPESLGGRMCFLSEGGGEIRACEMRSKLQYAQSGGKCDRECRDLKTPVLPVWSYEDIVGLVVMGVSSS